MKLINKKVLILPIKKKWFDMIRYGEKLEEYRDIKPYYEVRFQNHFGLILIENQKSGITKLLQGEDVPEEIRKEPVQEIIFRNGYGKNAPQILAKCSIRIGHGRTDWGAEEGKQYFILEIIEKMDYKCAKCFYFGKPGDAPEDIPDDCMWEPSENNGWEMPCEEIEQEREEE